MNKNLIEDKMRQVPSFIETTRNEIDEIDQALLSLIAKRRAVVLLLFEEKKKLEIPRFDKIREDDLIQKRRAFAESIGIPGQLAEDFFRMVLEYNRI